MPIHHTSISSILSSFLFLSSLLADHPSNMDPEQLFPNEMWLSSFEFMDRRTLKSVRLICRHFYDLSQKVFLRDITWSTTSDALCDYWEQNPSLAIFPRDLSVCLMSETTEPVKSE